MNVEQAEVFVEQWVQGWNAHDLDRIMAHYAPDVVFTSPLAARIVPGCDGVIRGRSALRAYWTEGLRLIPDLHFEVLSFSLGVDVIVINYRNQVGRLTYEVLEFDGPLVTRGHGTYVGGVVDPSRPQPD